MTDTPPSDTGGVRSAGAHKRTRRGGGRNGRPRTPNADPAASAHNPPKKAQLGQMSKRDRQRERHDPPGLAARRAALEALLAVLHQRQPFEEALDRLIGGLDARDRAFSRRLGAAGLRHRGQVEHVVSACLASGLPKGGVRKRLSGILHIGAVQLLYLDGPDHAAVDMSVRLAAEEGETRHFRPLVNGVLRRIQREREALLADAPAHALPDWLMTRWKKAWGPDTAQAMAAHALTEPPLDITLRNPGSMKHWAERLDATALPTGTLRRATGGLVPDLPGFEDGAWWVQDAAAALPARLLGDVSGMRVLDMCAAPGGKTAQLAAAGAQVTALDRSPGRLKRVRANLDRLGLRAEIVAADGVDWTPDEPFDAVLLDAPCSATGTLRRHPDVAYLKTAADIASLTALQDALLASALRALKPGGRLVYCTCSLEPDEGERRTEALVRGAVPVRRVPITPDDVGGVTGWVSGKGELRVLPHTLEGPSPELSGTDGFFAARFEKV